MNPLVYVLLAAVALGAGAFAFVPQLMGSSRADKRMKALQGDIQANRRENTAARTRDERRKHEGPCAAVPEFHRIILVCRLVLRAPVVTRHGLAADGARLCMAGRRVPSRHVLRHVLREA